MIEIAITAIVLFSIWLVSVIANHHRHNQIEAKLDKIIKKLRGDHGNL